MDYDIYFNPAADNFKIVDNYKKRELFKEWTFHKRRDNVRKELSLRFYWNKKNLSIGISEQQIYQAWYKLPLLGPRQDKLDLELAMNYLYKYHRQNVPQFSSLPRPIMDLFIRREYYDLALKKMNLEVPYLYKDHYGNLLRSEFEFYFSAYCYYNNIRYEYEKRVSKSIVSDYYLIDLDTYIELAGLLTSKDHYNYGKKILKKEHTYKALNLKCEFIKPKNYLDQFSEIRRYFRELGLKTEIDTEPYYKKYTLSHDAFIVELTKSLQSLNNQEKPDAATWYAKNSIFGNYLKNQELSVYEALKKYVGQPNRLIRLKHAKNTQKTYFSKYENVKFECDYVKSILGYTPSQTEAYQLNRTDKRISKYKEMFRHIKSAEFCVGGKYYGLIDYYKNILPDLRHKQQKPHDLYSDRAKVKSVFDEAKTIFGFHPKSSQINNLDNINGIITRIRTIYKFVKVENFCIGGKFHGLVDHYKNVKPGHKIKPLSVPNNNRKKKT